MTILADLRCVDVTRAFADGQRDVMATNAAFSGADVVKGSRQPGAAAVAILT